MIHGWAKVLRRWLKLSYTWSRTMLNISLSCDLLLPKRGYKSTKRFGYARRLNKIHKASSLQNLIFVFVVKYSGNLRHVISLPRSRLWKRKFSWTSWSFISSRVNLIWFPPFCLSIFSKSSSSSVNSSARRRSICNERHEHSSSNSLMFWAIRCSMNIIKWSQQQLKKMKILHFWPFHKLSKYSNFWFIPHKLCDT